MNPLILILLILLNIFKTTPSKARLEKVPVKSKFERACDTVAPYVLLAAIIIMIILILVVLVKYGGYALGTEANHWYNGELA